MVVGNLSRKRHMLKTLTWRCLATTDTLLLGWLVTGDFSIGLAIGGLEFLTKMFLYYVHERLWYKSSFGRIGESSDNVVPLSRNVHVTDEGEKKVVNQ